MVGQPRIFKVTVMEIKIIQITITENDFRSSSSRDFGMQINDEVEITYPQTISDSSIELSVESSTSPDPLRRSWWGNAYVACHRGEKVLSLTASSRAGSPTVRLRFRINNPS